MKRKFSSTLIAIILLCSMSLSVFAENLTQRQTEIQKQIRENRDKLKEVENNLSEAMDEVRALNASIAEYETQISKLNGKLANLEDDIKETEKKLKEAEDNQNERVAALETRTLAMLKMGDTTYLDILLSSADFNDLITHYYMIGKMAGWDNDFIEEMEAKIEESKVLKEKLDKKKAEVVEAKADVEKKTVALKNAKVKKASYVNKLSDEEKALQSEIEAYNKELQKVNYAIAEAERRAAANNSGETTYNKYTGGVLSWPTRTTKRVNSIYAPGGRTDIAVSGTTHKGIDLYAPHGTPIYAAAEGQVVYINYAGWGGGYGTYVVLSHGNGLYTLYAHGSGVGNISVGSTVTTNSVIMYSGNTGWSYGAHLHFEVCLGTTSNKVNPAPYLGIQNREGYIQ